MNRLKFICGAALCAAAGLWIGASFAGPEGMENSVTALTCTANGFGSPGAIHRVAPAELRDRLRSAGAVLPA